MYITFDIQAQTSVHPNTTPNEITDMVNNTLEIPQWHHKTNHEMIKSITIRNDNYNNNSNKGYKHEIENKGVIR